MHLNEKIILFAKGNHMNMKEKLVVNCFDPQDMTHRRQMCIPLVSMHGSNNGKSIYSADHERVNSSQKTGKTLYQVLWSLLPYDLSSIVLMGRYVNCQITVTDIIALFSLTSK